MCFWWQRGAHFCKNTRTKCMRPQISSKSLLTNRIFDASSYQDPSVIFFFHLASPKEGPLCSRPTFLRRFLRLHRGGIKQKRKEWFSFWFFQTSWKSRLFENVLPTVGGKHFFENVSDAKQSLPKRQFSARVAKNTIFRTLQGHMSASPGPSVFWIDRWMWAVGRI